MQISLALPDKEPLREKVAVTRNVRDYRSSLVRERLTVVNFNKVEEKYCCASSAALWSPKLTNLEYQLAL